MLYSQDPDLSIKVFLCLIYFLFPEDSFIINGLYFLSEIIESFLEALFPFLWVLNKLMVLNDYHIVLLFLISFGTDLILELDFNV